MTCVLWRRFLACMLLCCLFLPVCAPAEGIDLDALDDDAFVALYQRMNELLVERGIEKTAVLAQGTYTIGKMLPPGTYTYTCLAKGDDWGMLTVSRTEDSDKNSVWEVVSAHEDGEEPDTVFLTLDAGDVLVSAVPFSLTVTGVIRFQ